MGAISAASGPLGTGPLPAEQASGLAAVRFGTSQLGGAEAWYQAGLWGINAAQALSFNVLRAVPFVTGRSFRIDRLGFWVTSVGGAGARTQIGIYRAADGVGLPTSLLFDSGDFDTDGGAANLRQSSAAPLPLTLTDPLYWFVLLNKVAAVAPTIQTIAATDGQPVGGFDINTLRQTHLFVALVLGAGAPLPVAFPAGAAWAASNYPVVVARGV